MTGPEGARRGPPDPAGYSITAGPQGWVWTRRADDHTSDPHPTRVEAVRAALADRDSGPGAGEQVHSAPPG